MTPGQGARRSVATEAGSPARFIPWLILIAIVLAALVLRLYRLPELTSFHGDQGRDALVVNTMLQTGQPVLGGPIVSTGNYVRGPAYYYLLAPAFALAQGDPAGGAIMTALADTATVALLAVLGYAIGGWTVGLVAAALWATGAWTVTMARFTWNPQWIPALALLSLLCVLAVARGRPRWFLLVGPLLAVAWQVHDQTVFLGVAIAIWWLIVRPSVPLRFVAASIGLGIAVTLPYLWYEATNGLADLRAMVGQVIGGVVRSGSPVPGRAMDDQLRTLVGGAQAFMPGSGVADIALWVIAGAGAVWCIRRVPRSEDRDGPLLLLTVAALTPLYLLWPAQLQGYYLYVTWTVVALFVGLGVAWAWRARRSLGVVAAALVFTVAATSMATTFGAILDQPALGGGTLAGTKHVVDEIVADEPRSPFAVRLVSALRGFDAYEVPYRYLLERATGPSLGRVDLPTVVIFEPPDIDDGAKYGGRIISGARIVSDPPPTLDVDLLRDQDVATANGVSPAWGGPQSGVETASDSGRPNVRIVVRPEDGQLPDGRTIAQAIDITEPGRYLVRFEARTDLSLGTGRVIAEARGRDGKHLAVAPDGAGDILAAGPGWTVGSFFIDAPEATSQIIVYLRNSGLGTVDVRDVSVRRVLSTVLPGVPIH